MPVSRSHNLRDMGGYLAAGDRHTRWGTLFRSGTTAILDEAGVSQLANLGLAAIYDLRDSQERRRRPAWWQHSLGVPYYCRDYELSVADLSQLIGSAAFDVRDAENLIQATYCRLPEEQAAGYRELFQLLIQGRVPLLFNCTAGKDRTGFAAALILHTLGVSRALIAADYALTEECLPQLLTILSQDPRYAKVSTFDRSTYLPLLRAEASYLDFAFAEIARVHGGIGRYLEDRLGVGEQEVERLRELLLQ